MDAEAALAWLDAIIPPQTGERLSDLQKVILVQVWLENAVENWEQGS